MNDFTLPTDAELIALHATTEWQEWNAAARQEDDWPEHPDLIAIQEAKTVPAAVEYDANGYPFLPHGWSGTEYDAAASLLDPTIEPGSVEDRALTMLVKHAPHTIRAMLDYPNRTGWKERIDADVTEWLDANAEAWDPLHVAVVATAKRSSRGKLTDLMAVEFKALQWVVPGVIPEGTTLLVAPPKAGKSWLALDVALACATGGKAMGSVDVGEARPVLYIDLESGERRLQERVKAQGWSTFGSFEYVLEREDAMPEFEAFMAQHKGQRPLVVIDTLAAVMADKPKDRSAYKHEYETLSGFQRLTKADPGSAVLIIHHTRKLTSDDPMDKVSGTNGVTGAVDTPIVLDRPDRHAPEGNLNVMARDFEGGEFAVSFRDCTWHLVGDTVSAAAQAHEVKAIERKRGNLGPVKQGVLLIIESDTQRIWGTGEVLGLYGGAANDSTLRNAITELAEAGLIEKVERGKYRAIVGVSV